MILTNFHRLILHEIISITESNLRANYTNQVRNKLIKKIEKNTKLKITQNALKNLLEKNKNVPSDNTLNRLIANLFSVDFAEDLWSKFLEKFYIPTELINKNEDEIKLYIGTLNTSFILDKKFLIDKPVIPVNEINSPNIATKYTPNAIEKVIIQNLKGYYHAYHLDLDKTKIVLNHVCFDYNENFELKCQFKSMYYYKDVVHFYVQKDGVMVVVNNSDYELSLHIVFQKHAQNQLLLGTFQNTRDNILNAKKIILIKKSNEIQNIEHFDFNYLNHNTQDTTEEQKILLNYFLTTSDNNIQHHYITNIDDLQQITQLSINQPVLFENIIGCYYCYFKIQTSIIRAKAVFYKDETGIIKFKYNTESQYKTLNLYTFDEKIYISVQNVKSNTFIFFAFCYVPKSKVIICNYLTIHNHHSISGIEIFIKESNDSTKFSSLKTGQVQDKKQPSVNEEIIYRFFSEEYTKPQYVETELNTVEQLKEKINTSSWNCLLSMPSNSHLYSELCNTKWNIYSYYENGKYLSICILQIKHSKSVQIEAIDHLNQIEQFEGKFNVFANHQIVIFDFYNTSKTELVHIRLHLNSTNTYSTGIFVNTDNQGKLISGICLAEKVTDRRKSLKPVIFSEKKSILKLSENIINLFKDREKNYIKAPKGIFDEDSLNTFLETQTRKPRKNYRIHHKNDFFISAPIFSISTIDFSKLKVSITDIKKILEDKYKLNLFWAGLDINEEEHKEKKLAHKSHEILDELSDSESYIAIILNNKSTGVFLELGWALNSGKKSYIFTRKKDFLPFFLKNYSRERLNLNIILFENYEDLLEKITQILEKRFNCIKI